MNRGNDLGSSTLVRPANTPACIRDIERVIFTAIPLSSRSRKRQRRVNASIIDFIDALKNDQRDSIRDDIFFFLFFLLYENFLSVNSKIEGYGF